MLCEVLDADSVSVRNVKRRLKAKQIIVVGVSSRNAEAVRVPRSRNKKVWWNSW